MTTEQQIRKTLDGIIDEHSLSYLLGSLIDACRDKAKHIRSTWDYEDDTPISRKDMEDWSSRWDAAGEHVFTVVCRINV